jgi:hypothetical protein
MTDETLHSGDGDRGGVQRGAGDWLNRSFSGKIYASVRFRDSIPEFFAHR